MTAIVTVNQAAASLSTNLDGSGASYIPALQTQLGIGATGAAETSSTICTGPQTFAVGTGAGNELTTNVIWNTAPVVSFGSWNVAKNLFTFNKTVTAIVSQANIVYCSSSLNNNVRLVCRLFINGNIAVPGSNSGGTAFQTSLIFVEGAATINRVFHAGDTVAVVVSASATNPNTVADRSAGSVTFGGITTQTSMDITVV